MKILKNINNIGKYFRKGGNISRIFYKFSRNPLSVVGLILFCIIVLCAIFAQYLAPYPESAGAYVNFEEAKQPPSYKHFCGTDVLGRDILSRILFGTRYSLIMGIFVLLLIAPIGVTLGLIAGYFKGSWLEIIIMRVTDIFVSIPTLILALAICALLTPNLQNALLAISFSWWPWYTRLVYGLTSSLKEEYFVKLAEVSGANIAHILFREILPNFSGTILTKMTLDMGWVILTAANLSFVGLGIQPPTPDLGNMVADGALYLPELWWVAIFPALSIVLIVLSLNLLGDGISDIFGVERI